MDPSVLAEIRRRGSSLKSTAASPLLHRPLPVAREDAKRAEAIVPRGDDVPDWEMLLERVRGRTVVPFVGAGLSCSVLPLWDKLIDRVLERLEMPTMKGERLPVKTEFIREELDRRRVTSIPRQGKGIAETKTSGLDDEFLAVFKDHLKTQELERWSDSLLLGAKPPSYLYSENIRMPTRGHRALVTGPWPLILTTNWDSSLEAGYHMMNLNPGEVWDDVHPEHNYFTRSGTEIEVRFRQDIQRVYAELRAGLKPPRLLKLHGDFSDVGRREFVAGHSDYRQLMVRDIAFSKFMQHICSHYNFLFYGCSLADPDLLATLDGMVESLGSEVGPHFWLTADEVSDERKRFLIKHYSVYTIRTEEVWNFSHALSLLIKLCNKGWPIPRPLALRSFHYDVTNEWRTSVHVRVKHMNFTDVVAKALRSGQKFALGVSSGCSHTGRPSFGTQVFPVINELKLLSMDDARAFRFNMNLEHWRAQHCLNNCWFVSAQDRGAFGGSLRGVYEGVQHFIYNAIVHWAPDAFREEEAVSEPTEELPPDADVAVEEEETAAAENEVEKNEGDNEDVSPSETKEESSDVKEKNENEKLEEPPASESRASKGLFGQFFDAVVSFVAPEDSSSDSDSDDDETGTEKESDVVDEEENKKKNETDDDDDDDNRSDNKAEETKQEDDEATEEEKPKPTLLELANKESESSSSSSSDNDDDSPQSNGGVGDGNESTDKTVVGSPVSIGDELVLVLPLLATGGGLLHVHDVFSTTLSAIGECAVRLRGFKKISVVLCLGTHASAENDCLALLAEIDAGRLPIGQLLARAMQGRMEFTCIAPSYSRAGESGRSWTCRKQLMPIYSTFNELRKEMGLPADQTELGQKSLLSCNITDGSVVSLQL